jgi:Ca-activated chloride channel homolog
MLQRLLTSFLILSLVFSGGCSLISKSVMGEKEAQPAPSAKKKKYPYKKKVEIPPELKNIQLPPQGKYAGDRYDWVKVKKELDKIPKNADEKTILKKLYTLAAEDYTPYIHYFNTFNTSIIQVEKGPGGLKMKLPEEKKVNIVILVDSSGSMAGKVSGGVKMDLAKQAVKQFAAQMPEGANVSLMVYGHKGTNSKKDKAMSCKSIEEVYPLGAYQEGSFNNALNTFKPSGWTPLSAAIEQAKQKLASHSKAENILYIVSDGVETCGGDPVEAARQLHQSNMKAVVNIIGLDVDDAGQQSLQSVADAGGGEYSSVDSEVSLDEYFAEERNRLYNAWSRWANEHYDKASKVSNKKYEDLQRISNEMYERTEHEAQRFYKMTEYLENERNFEFDLLSSVRDTFWDREKVINNYNFDTTDRLQDIVLNKADKIQDDVLDKADKEQDKLY